MSEQSIAFEEVPGSRTTQDAVSQPQRERIAYEELQLGDIIQEGDEWQNECGRWRPFLVLDGSRVQVRQSQRVRRPYNITMMLREFASQAQVLAEVRADEERLVSRLELLRSEYAKLQGERDELRESLAAEQRAHKCTMTSGMEACKERDEALAELAQAREANQQSLKTITDNADTFVDQVTVVERERDEARAELQRLQEVVGNLYNEPTARQVQDMLRTWATELDWSAGCFGSFGRSQMDIIQQTMVAVIQRIETMINPEGGIDGE